MSRLTSEDILILKAPFPNETLGVKVQSFSKDRSKAALVLYLQHTDVQDRLDQVDPNWNFEILNEYGAQETYYVKARLTLKGATRENVGEGNDPKAAYSDALKRCAMLFGVGRFLYDSLTVWVPYDESRDKFRSWTFDDYAEALRHKGLPARTTASGRATLQAVGGSTKKVTEPQMKRLQAIARERGWDYTKDVKPYMKTRFNIDSGLDLNMQQYDEVVQVLQTKLPPEVLPNAAFTSSQSSEFDFNSAP